MLNVPFRRARGARPLSLRAARGAALVLAALAAGACGDDDITEEDEPQIQAVQLSVTPAAGQPVLYTIRPSGANPTVQLRVGTSTVAAVALDANNQPIVLDEPFELRLVSTVTGPDAAAQTPLTGSVTFNPSGGLTNATVAATSVTSVQGWVRLVHLEEDHSDFDAQVTFQVTP